MPPDEVLAERRPSLPGADTSPPARWVRLLPLLVPLAVVAWMAVTRRWVADDAYINFRVVDNLFAGHGPVFNVGERVEVATSTAWLGVLAGMALVLPDAVPLPVAAVAAGVALTVTGLAAAQIGAVALAPGRGRTGVALPAGALVLAALPPVWDFATSGLENGLAIAWLGGCFLALALRSSAPRCEDAEHPPAYRPLWLPVLVGLGPLVRPDLAFLSLALGAALLATSRRSAASWLGGGAAALALPVASQVFRMGFYAALVPTTALAKSATSARWDDGLTYLRGDDGRWTPAPPGTGVVAMWPYVGMFSVAAGLDVHVADRFALGEPVGARLTRTGLADDRVGHGKDVPQAWLLARFAAPTGDPVIEAAREALGCGTLRELVEATSEPLTVSRFLRNIAAAPRLTALRVPADPSAARATFCG